MCMYYVSNSLLKFAHLALQNRRTIAPSKSDTPSRDNKGLFCKCFCKVAKLVREALLFNLLQQTKLFTWYKSFLICKECLHHDGSNTKKNNNDKLNLA